MHEFFNVRNVKKRVDLTPDYIRIRQWNEDLFTKEDNKALIWGFTWYIVELSLYIIIVVILVSDTFVEFFRNVGILFFVYIIRTYLLDMDTKSTISEEKMQEQLLSNLENLVRDYKFGVSESSNFDTTINSNPVIDVGYLAFNNLEIYKEFLIQNDNLEKHCNLQYSPHIKGYKYLTKEDDLQHPNSFLKFVPVVITTKLEIYVLFNWEVFPHFVNYFNGNYSTEIKKIRSFFNFDKNQISISADISTSYGYILFGKIDGSMKTKTRLMYKYRIKTDTGFEEVISKTQTQKLREKRQQIYETPVELVEINGEMVEVRRNYVFPKIKDKISISNLKKYQIKEAELVKMTPKCIVCFREILEEMIDDIPDDDTVSLLMCCQSFAHTTHIQIWLRENKECPYCDRLNHQVKIIEVLK